MNTWITRKDLMPDQKDFYSSLNMEDIINVDYRNAEGVFNILATKIWVIIKICMFKMIHYYLMMYLRTCVLKTCSFFYLYLD